MKLESFKDVKTNQKNDPRFLNQSFFSSFDGQRHRCTIEIYPSVDIGSAYVVRQQQRTAPQQDLNKQETIRGVMKIGRVLVKTRKWTNWKPLVWWEKHCSVPCGSAIHIFTILVMKTTWIVQIWGKVCNETTLKYSMLCHFVRYYEKKKTTCNKLTTQVLSHLNVQIAILPKTRSPWISHNPIREVILRKEMIKMWCKIASRKKKHHLQNRFLYLLYYASYV